MSGTGQAPRALEQTAASKRVPGTVAQLRAGALESELGEGGRSCGVAPGGWAWRDVLKAGALAS